ncbi:uncharacterized protein LOC108879743 isoform X2 [Lates calcarifer]|uniref:Uncharacterized protein LOC108879743 isoform X2 n=1 Tax=Lates calcarifer TaxID=8187 RepID=A0AAJ7LNH2_LATCA|nr:uncharacterized protein LOC108879743 isoform X2 [Lates calcarifer]
MKQSGKLQVPVTQFQRAWKYTTSKGSCHFGCVLFRRTVKAFCVGLLWVASVLIDAEWYVCCHNHNPREDAELQCKTKAEITSGLRPVFTIAEMKTNSRMYGISLLFGITFVGTFLLSTWTICADSCCLKCCKREILVHELMLEVGDDAVSETIKEKQKEIITRKVKDHIDDGKWEECLDLVEDLIDPINQVHSSTSTGYQSTRESQYKDSSQQREQEQIPLSPIQPQNDILPEPAGHGE